ncbi:MAG: FAD-linked oxidase, partial [Jiangellaceae bacterium]
MAAMTTAGKATIPDPHATDELARTLRGELIRPRDPDYDQRRRVWNGSIDRHPALIARCASVADVITSVRFARTHGLLVA